MPQKISPWAYSRDPAFMKTGSVFGWLFLDADREGDLAPYGR
jgi:hypothetical protein